MEETKRGMTPGEMADKLTEVLYAKTMEMLNTKDCEPAVLEQARRNLETIKEGWRI